MIINNRLSFLIKIAIIFCSISVKLNAQNHTPVSPKELNTIIDSITTIVKKYHIQPKVGLQIIDLINTKHKNGFYNSITNPNTLNDSLTNHLRAIDGDLHMSMIYKSPKEVSSKHNKPIKINETGIWSNYGLNELKVLDGNIGYLKIKHFTQHQFLEKIKPVISSSFSFLKNTDALIIDLRDNKGGFEKMVAHYISYFFNSKKPIHLSDYKCTLHNHTYSISTETKITGPKLPKIKIYILINANTASAAESFAYMLKHLKRATLIGETTAGAGNGASTHEINNRFSLQVSSEETINAVTKTSFEKIGVTPHIKIKSNNAFFKAYKLALQYAQNNNKRNIDSYNYQHLISFIPLSDKKNTTTNTNFSKYIGSYKSNTIEILISSENNILYGQMKSRGGKMKLTQLTEHTFKVGEIKERIQFIANKSGVITHLKGIDSPMMLAKTEN